MRKNASLVFLSIFFILAGIIVTLENFDILEGLSRLWPIFPLIVGAGFILLFHHSKKKEAGLIWIGSFISFLSVFFFYLNYTSWTNLATQWPFFLLIIGLAFSTTTFFIRLKVFTIMAVAFVMLFLTFYLIFAVSARTWPLSLVFFGISLYIIDYFNKRIK